MMLLRHAPRPLPMNALLLLLLALTLALPARAADKPFAVNGVGLGSVEADIKKRYPAAHCKPLEWKTDAADRRCDDSRVVVQGSESRITYYLKAGSVVAFDVRFDSTETPRFVRGLRGDWGAPKSESKDVIAKKGKEDREVYKALWEQGRDRALLTSMQDKKRAQLEVSRGGFADEVYRVR